MIGKDGLYTEYTITVGGRKFNQDDIRDWGAGIHCHYAEEFDGCEFDNWDQVRKAAAYSQLAFEEIVSRRGYITDQKVYEHKMRVLLGKEKAYKPPKKEEPKEPENQIFKYRATSPEQLQKFIEKITRMDYEVMPKECTADMLTYRKGNTTIYIKIK